MDIIDTYVLVTLFDGESRQREVFQTTPLYRHIFCVISQMLFPYTVYCVCVPEMRLDSCVHAVGITIIIFYSAYRESGLEAAISHNILTHYV